MEVVGKKCACRGDTLHGIALGKQFAGQTRRPKFAVGSRIQGHKERVQIRGIGQQVQKGVLGIAAEAALPPAHDGYAAGLRRGEPGHAVQQGKGFGIQFHVAYFYGFVLFNRSGFKKGTRF
jgi:hypothetical protein